MKFLFFILLHSCICNFDNPTLSLTLLKDKSKLVKDEIELEPLKTYLESIQDKKCTNHTRYYMMFDSKEDKTHFYSDNPKIVEEIKKIKGLKHLSEAQQKECWLRTELAIFFTDTIEEYLKNLKGRSENHQHEILRLMKVAETVKMLLGVALDDLEQLDKELAKFLIYDIEYESKSI